MASAAFIAAAKRPNRELVTMLAVESVDAIVRSIDSQADWEDYESLSGLNTVATPGTLICGTNAPNDLKQTYYVSQSANKSVSPATVTTNPLNIETPATTAVARLVSTTVYGSLKNYGTNVTRVDGDPTQYTSDSGAIKKGITTVTLYGARDGGGYTSLGSADVNFSTPTTKTFSIATGLLTRGSWTFKLKITSIPGFSFNRGIYSSDYPGDDDITLTLTSHTAGLDPSYHAGVTRTMVLDLGLTPESDTVFSIDDIVPSGTTLAITARGGNSSPPSTNLGTIEDGDNLDPYRYYDFYLTFTPTADETPSVSKISISGGDSQFDYFGTHQDTPVQGVRPIIPSGAVGAISSKLDLRKVSTTGEASVKMNWTKFTGDLLADGYLRNKTVYISVGFPDLSSSDYEPIFTGLWYDWKADPKSMVITASIRDVLKRFQKVKIPTETVDGSGNINTTAKTWTAAHIIQAMLDIIDYIGVQDRFIDRDAFETIRDDVLTGNAWKVTRTITKPVEAWKLLGELSVMSGCFLIPLPTGKLTIRQYDDTDEAVATFDANFCDFGTVDGNLKELFTRQFVYYAPNTAEPGDNADDYDKGYSYINSTAETAWDESSEQSFYDKWKLGYVSASWTTTAHQNLAARWDDWFAVPRIEVKVKNVPMYHIGVNIGDMVAVTNLRVPVSDASWPGFTSAKKFMVMSKSIDIRTGMLAFDLMEI